MKEGKSFEISQHQVLEAYKRVKANRGAGGTDSINFTIFEKDLKNNLYKLWNRMSSGSYFPTTNVSMHYVFDVWMMKHYQKHRLSDTQMMVRQEGVGLLNNPTPCLAEDEGGPLGAAMQVEASNHRKLLWSKAMVVSVTEKAKQDFVR